MSLFDDYKNNLNYIDRSWMAGYIEKIEKTLKGHTYEPISPEDARECAKEFAERAGTPIEAPFGG